MDKDANGYYVTNAKGDKLYWDGTDWKPKQPSLMQRIGGGLSQAGKGVRAGLDALTGLPSADILQGKSVDTKTSPDPLSIMQRHPYATAAATGALTGPTFGLPAALEGLEPVVGPLAGALEQMGYQGISEKGEQLAGPKHTLLGALPGLLAPFASPALTAMGGGRMAAKAATEAATGQAAESTGQKIAEKGLGMTESEAKGLARPKSIEPNTAEQLSGAKGALWNARREAREKVGQQYNPIYEPLDKLPLESEHLASIKAGVKDARAMARARGQTLSPTANKLLGSLNPQEKAAEQAATGHFGLAKPPDTLESIAEAEEWEDVEPQPKGKSVIDETSGLTEVQPVKKSALKTIGQVRGRLSQLRQAADNPSLSSVDRSAIFQASKPLVEILDNVVPEEQKDLLRSINAQYAQVSKVLPFKSMLAMNRAGTLPELGKAWFGEGNKAATSLVLAGMNDEQKNLMRKAFASYALETQGKDTATFLADNKELIGELGFPKELGSIAEWKKLVTAKQRMTTKIPNLPSQGQFIRGVRGEIARSGFTPEQLDAAGKALYDQAQRNPTFALRRIIVYLPMSAAMGYGALHQHPELWVPVGASMVAYLGKNAVINSRMLPLYRDMVMGGWTVKGGRALGKAIVAATRDSLQNQSLTQQIGGAASAP